MNTSCFGLIFLVSVLAVYSETQFQRLTIYKASFMAYGMAAKKDSNELSLVNGVLLTEVVVLTAGHFCSDFQVEWFVFGMGSVQYQARYDKGLNISTKAQKAVGPLCLVKLSEYIEIGGRIARSILSRPKSPRPDPNTILYMGTYGNVASLNEDGLGDSLHYRAVYVVHVESEEEIGLAADAEGGKLELDDTHVGSAVWIPTTRIIVGIVLKRDKNAQTVAAFLPPLRELIDKARYSYDPVFKLQASSGNNFRYIKC